MTIEDKRSELQAICESQNGCSSDCPIIKFVTPSVGCSFEIDAVTEEIYSKLHGDAINHPNHYQGKNECIDVMIAMFGIDAVKHFCMCNAYKYRFRADKKNGAEDIAKAEWYESKLIELGGTER